MNLIGRSGAGKTALVLAGLCPELRQGPDMLAVYLDAYGDDWEGIGKRNVGIASGPWDAAGVRQVFECAQGIPSVSLGALGWAASVKAVLRPSDPQLSVRLWFSVAQCSPVADAARAQ